MSKLTSRETYSRRLKRSMCVCILYSVSHHIRLMAVAVPGKFAADDHPHLSTRVHLPTTLALDNVVRETHTESPEGSRRRRTLTEIVNSVSGNKCITRYLYFKIMLQPIHMGHPDLNECILLLLHYFNSPDVVFVRRWIPVASGHPQERPPGECLCLRRYTDRLVARAHCRPLYQDVSFKLWYLFCYTDIHEL